MKNYYYLCLFNNDETKTGPDQYTTSAYVKAPDRYAALHFAVDKGREFAESKPPGDPIEKTDYFKAIVHEIVDIPSDDLITYELPEGA